MYSIAYTFIHSFIYLTYIYIHTNEIINILLILPTILYMYLFATHSHSFIHTSYIQYIHTVYIKDGKIKEADMVFSLI